MLDLKVNATLYFDGELYEAFKKAIAPKLVSHVLEDYMRRHLVELGGQQTVTVQEEPVDYEKLNRDHDKLVKEVNLETKLLEKKKVYGDLAKLAVSLDVTPKDLSGLDEAAPKLLTEWTGLQEDALQFISLLRNVRAKRELERKMAEAIKSGKGKTAETTQLQ